MSDHVTVGATHEIYVNGNKSWIKAEIQVERAPQESHGDAFDRASAQLQNKIMTIIEESAQTVIDYEAKARGK